MPTKMGNLADRRSRQWQEKPSVLQPRKNFVSGRAAAGRMVPPPPIHMLSPITFLYTRRLRIQSEALASEVSEELNFSVAVDVEELPQVPEPGKRRLRPRTLIDIVKLKRPDPWIGEEQESTGPLAS